MQVDPEEVKAFFRNMKGYKQIHIPERDLKRPTYYAFIEFEDKMSAKAVHDKHQVGACKPPPQIPRLHLCF